MSISFQGQFTHCARTMTNPPTQRLVRVTKESLTCAFPNLFDYMVVSMFLDPQGYPGETDSAYEPCSGSWYGLSYGTIHRDTLPVWWEFSRQIRWMFWRHLWRSIRSLGREPWPENSKQLRIGLAFFSPLPLGSFLRALDRLLNAGYLAKRIEQFPGIDTDVEMFYPTKLLVNKVRA